jgi:hypothetical protein
MTESKASARLQAYLVVIATIATVGFNFLSGLGYGNGVTPEVISNKYPAPVTPAGYAFTIWSLIYLGLAAFSVYQSLRQNIAKFTNVRTLYILSCALNCAWIYFWHHDQIVVCFVIILALGVTLFLITFRFPQPQSTREYWLAKAPFELYFGWVTCATLVNFALMLVYLRVGLTGSTWAFLSVVLILLAAVFGIFFRAKFSEYIYPLPIAWALTAIAVRQSGNTAVVVACAVGVIACLIASFSFVVNLPSHSVSQPASK